MSIYFFLLFVLCSSAELFEDYYKQAEEIMKNMTIDEKIGQMFFPKYHPNNVTDDILNKKPGGFVLYAKDFDF